MNSIEFEADVKNHSIKIPEEYSNLESKRLKVIIFEIDSKADKLPKGFYNPRKVTSFSNIASRDELYERKSIH